MTYSVTFSIVSHGQGDLVDQLLHDIDRFLQSGSNKVTLAITENLSGSSWTPKSDRFSLTFVENLRPKGFGANHNAAFERLGSDFFFVVNPDIRLLHKIDIDSLIRKIGEKEIVSPIVVNPQNEVEDFRRKDITISNLVRRRFSIQEKGDFEWFAGMFQGFRSSSFTALSGFDTRYFMYVEDCDICWRNYLAGGKISEIADVTVQHDARRSSLRRLRNFRWHLSSLRLFFLKKLGLVQV